MTAGAPELPRLLSPRRVATLLGMPWRDAKPLLVEAGVRIVRIGRRERAFESDVAAWIAALPVQQPRRVVAERGRLIAQLAAERLGIEPRRRRKTASEGER